jgi:hypothetical protein
MRLIIIFTRSWELKPTSGIQAVGVVAPIWMRGLVLNQAPQIEIWTVSLYSV